MKIKQIRRTAPELYLVIYKTRWLKREVERWVIAEPERKKVQKAPLGVGFKYEVISAFYFRDNDELAHDCWHQIEWMIRNDVDFFDNKTGEMSNKFDMIREDIKTMMSDMSEITIKKDTLPIKKEIPEKYEDIFNLIHEYYQKEPAGGSLHIALDDGNMDDGNIEFCLKFAKENNDSDAITIGHELQKFTEDERIEIYNLKY